MTPVLPHFVPAVEFQQRNELSQSSVVRVGIYVVNYYRNDIAVLMANECVRCIDRQCTLHAVTLHHAY